MNFLKSLLLTCLLIPGVNAYSQDLDEATQEAIKTACHGNLLDKDSGFISSWLYRNSPVCEEIIEQGNDADVEPILNKYNARITQKDLNRMYGDGGAYQKAPSSIELECTVRDPMQEQGVDGECQRRRERLVADNMPMTQQQYEQIAAYCRDEPAQSACIDQWVNTEWAKGNRLLPKRNIGGLDFDSLMANNSTLTETESENIEIGFAELGTMDNESQLKGGEVGFDNIYAGREQIALDAKKQTLFTQGEQIASQCQCAFGEGSCYVSGTFKFDQINQAVQQQVPGFAQSKSEVCNSWVTNLRGKTSNQNEVLDVYVKNSEIILSNLSKLDSGFNNMISQLGQQEREIDAEIARREAQQQRIAEAQAAEARGNAIGRIIAIGAVAGVVGTSGLPTEQGMKLFTSMAQDILNDDGTMSNTAALMQANGYGAVELEDTDFNQITNEAMDRVLVYDSPQDPVQSYDSLSPTIADSSNTPGNYGAYFFSSNSEDLSIGFVTSRGSDAQAEADARRQCGSSCDLGDTFGIDVSHQAKYQCAAVVFGTAPGGTGKRYFRGWRSSLSEAEEAAIGQCDYQSDNLLRCNVVASGCN